MGKNYTSKLSKYVKSDPIARFFKYQSGDVIKITNKDGFVSYRIVK